VAAPVSDAATRVVWLLRTFHDVRQGGYGADSTGAGVRMMPSDWGRYSYPELERCLIELRENGRRREWWHCTRRYRDGVRIVLEVRVRRTRLGAVPVLPRNCELAAGAVWTGEKRARVVVRRWPEDVRLDVAEAGVRHLVEMMYGGQRERIVLPPAVAAVAFGG
jgi:hypothetical protein